MNHQPWIEHWLVISLIRTVSGNVAAGEWEVRLEEEESESSPSLCRESDWEKGLESWHSFSYIMKQCFSALKFQILGYETSNDELHYSYDIADNIIIYWTLCFFVSSTGKISTCSGTCLTIQVWPTYVSLTARSGDPTSCFTTGRFFLSI